MTSKRTAPADPAAVEPKPRRRRFKPVAVRARHDGWTAQRQVEFIEALAQSGCVDEACRRVGMSPSSAYALRQRIDASSFRQAWDHALDYAIRRLSDAAFSRALHGVARPVFYQGEQIGERRHYDERLTMFLLRYRDPVHYGAWLDGREVQRHPEGAALTLLRSLIAVEQDGFADEHGLPRPHRAVMPSVISLSDDAVAARAMQVAAAMQARTGSAPAGDSDRDGAASGEDGEGDVA